MFERMGQYYKIRLVFAVIILFFVSLGMSCQELRYLVLGKTVDAGLMSDRVETRHGRRGSTHEQRVIRYSFADKDTQRQEYADVGMDWPQTEGATVKVQYIAGGDMQSRLLGQHNTGWVILFFSSLIAGFVGVYVLSREK